LARRKKQALSLSQILNQIGESDLKVYLTQYAKNDREFEMALKAHFISRVTTGDEDSKYYGILSQIIKPHTLAHPKLSLKEKKIINVILQDLTYQMGDLLSTQNFRESYYVIKNCLDKIAYLQYKYIWQSKAIESYRVTFVNGLELLIKSEIAPGLRAEIEQDMHALVLKSYFFPSTPDIWYCLHQSDSWSSDQSEELVNNLIQKYQHQKENPELVFLILLLSYQPTENYEKILFELDYTEVFKGLILLIEKNHLNEARYIISSHGVGYNYNSKILECIILHKQAQYGKLDKAILALNEEHYDMIGLELLLTNLSDDYLSSSISKLQTWIKTLSFKNQCNIYAKAQSNNLLLKALEQKNDIEWIKVYDKLLLERNLAPELEVLYRKTIIDYLDNHIGEKAIQFMSKVNHRLSTINQHPMLQRIQKVLYDRYAYRDSTTSNQDDQSDK